MNSVDTVLEVIAHPSDGGQLVGKIGGLKDDAVSQVRAHPPDGGQLVGKTGGLSETEMGESANTETPSITSTDVAKKVRFESEENIPGCATQIGNGQRRWR